MKGTELLARVREAGYRPVVRMTKYGADNIECCMNEPQMGRVVRAEEDHDRILKVWIDLNEFDEYNDQHADRNWYDRNSQPCLTAKESGNWPRDGIELIYLMLDDDFTRTFEIVGEGHVTVLVVDDDEKATLLEALRVAMDEGQIDDDKGTALAEKLSA